jgi:uncharacterized membrane protein
VSERPSLADPRFIVAYTIILGFAGAYINNPSDTMTGALIAGFAGAWGYYLGSSNSSSAVREQVGKALEIAAAAQPATPPDVVLKPGETAQAQPGPGQYGDRP